MRIISDEDQAALKERFKRELKNDVTLTLLTQRTAGLMIPGRELLALPASPWGHSILAEVGWREVYPTDSFPCYVHTL